MSSTVATDPTMPDHFSECDGNGSIDCWECGGEGFVVITIDDLTDGEATCFDCGGRGTIRCPGCAAIDAAGAIGDDDA